MKKLLLLFVLVAPALGQRYDNFASTVASASGIGNLMQAVPNATITVCTFPGTGGTPCTNKATTYTSQTLITACAAATQVVLQGSSTCQATGDTLGNFGFWAPPTKYTVCIGGTNVTTICGTVTATIDAPNNASPGVFTGSAMQEYIKTVLNNCNTLTEYQASAFGTGLFATEGVTGCVAEPASSTTQAYGVAGFANTSTSGGAAANGVIGLGRALVTDSNAVGAQFGATDVTNAAFNTMELTGVVSQVQATNSAAAATYQLLSGYGAIANFTNQPAKFWSGNSIQPIGNGYNCATVGSNQWNNCVTSFDGATALFANIGTTSSASGASDSAPIQGSARASGTADTNAQITFLHAAPSGACPALVTIAINVAATASTTATIYECAPSGSWHALRPIEIGTCTMAAGTCTVTWGTSFAVPPICTAQWNGTGALTGFVSANPSTTNCVVTSSVNTNTAVMQVTGIGAPN